MLVIQARHEPRPNPCYQAGRTTIDYTAARLNTQGLHSWQRGRFDIDHMRVYQR